MDADAENVRHDIIDGEIIIEDDGLGMDRDGVIDRFQLLDLNAVV